MDYDFNSNFAAAPLGAFTEANKQLAWSNRVTEDADKSGQFFSLVDDSRLGGRCCRMRYPAGQHGMQQQFYQIRIKSPQTIANISYDFLFEPEFDIAPPNEQKTGGGKIPVAINWGEIGGATELRGTRAMWWYNGQGSNYQKTKWSPVCQDQRTGEGKVRPVVYSDNIELDRIYRFEIQILGGDNGFANYWLDDQPLGSVAPQHLQVTATDDVIFDFAFFAGGGAEQACRWDSYARLGNVRCYSGERRAQAPKEITLEAGEYTLKAEGKLTFTRTT